MKAPDLATCLDQATNGMSIARSAFQKVSKADCAQFGLADSLRSILTQGDERPSVPACRLPASPLPGRTSIARGVRH